MIQRYALTKPCRLNWNIKIYGKNGHPLDGLDAIDAEPYKINTRPIIRKYLAH